MISVVKKEEKKDVKKVTKGKKSVNSKKNSKKIYEKYTCYVVGVIVLLLLVAVIKNLIFLPALLITIGLELFCIAYYYIDNKNKKSLVYGLFEFGVFLVIVAIVYTIIKIV